MEKLQVVKKTKSHQLLFIQSMQHGAFFTLFMLISHHWAPALEPCVKLFFSNCLPSVCSTVANSKFIFIVANVIVIFLVRESRLSKASSELDVYGEYLMQNQKLQNLASTEVKEKGAISEEEPLLVEKTVQEMDEEIGVGKEEEKEKKVIEKECEYLVEEEVIEVVEKVVVMVGRECEDLVEQEAEKKEEMKEEEEEEGVPPAEEVNKRVEDFIAMVNMERKREAMMLICCNPSSL